MVSTTNQTVSGLAMVFPSPLNTVKTDDRCVNGWSVFVVHMLCLEIHKSAHM